MRIPAQPAGLPHEFAPDTELPGWDPAWSRLVEADTHDGVHTFHVLDTGPELERLGVKPDAVILAVHGNPTWSYLWRHVAATSLATAREWVEAASTDSPRRRQRRPRIWRLVAPDQLDMGFSERLEHTSSPTPGRPRSYRTLAERLSDLDAVVRALGLDVDAQRSTAPVPLFTLGHDWGGVISLGWAADHQHLVSGSISLNTAVHHDADEPIPAPLQAALAGPVLAGSTVVTTAFLDVTLGLGHPGLASETKHAYRAPYQGLERRGGIGGFVADIPADAKHHSYQPLRHIARNLSSSSLPTLLLWGALDPVFLDRYQQDLLERIPQVDLHRYETSGHLLAEDQDLGTPIFSWANAVVDEQSRPLDSAVAAASPRPAYRALWSFLEEKSDSSETALVDMTATRNSRPDGVSWATLSRVVNAIAVGLRRSGVKPGDRVSLLVQPGRDLTAALYAVLRVGATAVIADAGLGIQGMTRAVHTARPQWIIGELPGLTLARAQRWPGRRLSVSTLGAPLRAALQVENSLYRLADTYNGHVYHATKDHPDPEPAQTAAILFTSGSTGPAKGVRYTHDRLSALTQLLRDNFGVVPGSSLLAGFAPFALLGPAIGATSVTPKMSVTKPATLTATAVAEAAAAGSATMVFASPAALRNVVATAPQLSEDQRRQLGTISLMLSAGAPVAPDLMDQVLELMPQAEFHSPYGMTESLLLADIDRDTLRAAHREAPTEQHGVCVGHPVPGVEIAIAPLNADGTASSQLRRGTESQGILGEIVVSAPHMTAGYDRLWYTDHLSKRDFDGERQWHRTADIGRIDGSSRLWIEGRLQHVVTTAHGPLAPGGPEAQIDTLQAVSRSAVVGVGPHGTQAVVAVIEPTDRSVKPGLAPTWLSDQVRETVDTPIAAVLVTNQVPVDIRHNSKIDRTRLSRWAETVLSGGKVSTP
ncbi:alpha/beta fold hydrolase [Citricoccus muralis]|uniref:Alpha/beta fold hydrolase n=1 Tax=Citricoccus muralis TaxID=169134 RepID=A0ABY8H2W7_9MICC|nr:alpha/beta fold hydrolase [Citricoccus muralis]WFP15471.1 alpha/beta fold hydrolase [Citricoccus muralis]